MVSDGRLEPPRPCGHEPLNPMRLVQPTPANRVLPAQVQCSAVPWFGLLRPITAIPYSPVGKCVEKSDHHSPAVASQAIARETGVPVARSAGQKLRQSPRMQIVHLDEGVVCGPALTHQKPPRSPIRCLN